MPLKNIPLTKADFDALPWQGVVDECEQKECDIYAAKYFSRAKEAEMAGNEKAHEIYTLLGAITSLHLRADNKDEPFEPMAVLQNSRTAIVDDISTEHLGVLREIIGDVNDPELRARIADVIWIRLKDHKAAGIAIDAYLESASKLDNSEMWPPPFERIERAFRIATQLGRSAGYWAKVIQYIENLLTKLDGNDPKFFSCRLMELLLEQKQGNPANYAALSEKVAKAAETDGDYYKARACWELKANWDALSGSAEASIESKVYAAETYAKEAEAATSALAASVYMQKSIEALRRVGGQKKRVDELHARLLEIQAKVTGEMKVFSHQMDISEIVEGYRKHVSGKPLQEALFAFCLLSASPKVDKLRARVEETVKKHPMQFLVSGAIVNEKGKVIGIKPNMMSNDPAVVEKAKKAEMYSQAQFDRGFVTQALIEPVRYQILTEHYVPVRAFYPIVRNSPFVPEDRAEIFAHGLHAGLNGDYLTATHLLIPQVENSIRNLLEQRGVTVSRIDDQGIQDERPLNDLIYLPEVDQLFGEDLAFDLRGLLVERYGANLRNRLAHGLIPFENFYSIEVPYFWWLTLRLCCVPIIIQMRAEEKRNTVQG
jgi:hypothetical protein